MFKVYNNKKHLDLECHRKYFRESVTKVKGKQTPITFTFQVSKCLKFRSPRLGEVDVETNGFDHRVNWSPGMSFKTSQCLPRSFTFSSIQSHAKNCINGFNIFKFSSFVKKRPQMEDISACNKDIWTSGVFDDDVMGRGRNEIGFNFVSSHFIVVVFTIVVFIVFIVVVFVLFSLFSSLSLF